MRQLLAKRISLIFLCFFSMFLFTACEYNFENISNEKNEKIHEDIPADNIRNVNISGNARSITIKQGVTDNFEFYNADLDENNQYEVEVTYDEEGNDLNILVTMDNAEASNDVLGSVVVSIPKNEFEKIEITGEFNQVYLYTLNSDVFVRTNSTRVVMDLLADQLNHNITLVGSESNSFSGVKVYFDKLPENVKMEFSNIPQSAINAPFGLLTGDKLELGSGKPIISINNADKLDFYVETVDCRRTQKNSIDSGSVETPSEETPSEETSSDENDKIEISMEDVISLGKDEAVKYYDDLQLTNVYSYDNDHDRSVMSGNDGKREWWYVNFANEKNNYVNILIVDGEVEHVEHFD